MNCARTVLSIHLFTEVKGYVSTGVGDCFSALLVSLMVLRLVLVDRNPFWLSFFCIHGMIWISPQIYSHLL